MPATVSALRRYRLDLLLAIALALAAAFASFALAQRIDPVLLEPFTEDTWFESDMTRAYRNMTERKGDHYRAAVHPLYPAFTIPANKLLQKGLGLSELKAARVFGAAVAALWAVGFYALLRLIGLARVDAVLFTLLGLGSAAAVFWFTVPETYALGALSILFAFVVVAWSRHRKLGELWFVLAGVVTLGITVTNWMAGIAAAFSTFPWRRALQISANAVLLVTLLWGAQKYVVPSAAFFMGSKEEVKYVGTKESGGPAHIATAFLFHGMAMPNIALVDHEKRSDWPKLSVQTSAPWSSGPWSGIAAAIWFALLAVGAWALVTLRGNTAMRAMLGLVLAGQFALHLLYGRETFLYSLHYTPLLILLAALGSLTRMRPVVTVLVPVLLVLVATNNWRQLDTALTLVANNHTQRDVARIEMSRRPDDPWPRGEAHVILAWPGSDEADKSYLEPGGSFSPVPGSFGVSFWIVDEDGDIRATSDSLALTVIDQRFEWTRPDAPPALVTDTPYYHAAWVLDRPGRWRLTLEPRVAAGTELIAVVRSVGPAGGPVETLDWDGARLAVNERWNLQVQPQPRAVHLGREGSKDWIHKRDADMRWSGMDGWGYALIPLGARGHWTMVIEDAVTPQADPVAPAPLRAGVELELPDPRFATSMDAQVAHLMMSLVDDQTRSADPINTPIPWQRTGAYIVTALARAGRAETAERLARYLAEHDFYGGFGAEADAAGLALWALREVAARVDRADFDRWLWPHVERKADFILAKLSAVEPIYRSVENPIVPHMRHRDDNELVAEPARAGLIVGRMDQHRPLLYVNAVSYRGLVDAAWFAQRVGRDDAAVRWNASASDLRAAWVRAFVPPESHNDRTYISALWPTWVAADARETLASELRERWRKSRSAGGIFRKTPLWTYFDIAEAHQWLYLGRHIRAWQTMEWFWDHQVAPGLYTWWEDKGEGNTYRRWNQLRGWVAPRHVTPHYWTSAEMLMLQLDMLAYVDESDRRPVLVVGAGIPAAWLDDPMSVRGLSTAVGRLDWSWDGARMEVTLDGAHADIDVRLGPAFPRDATLQLARVAR